VLPVGQTCLSSQLTEPIKDSLAALTGSSLLLKDCDLTFFFGTFSTQSTNSPVIPLLQRPCATSHVVFVGQQCTSSEQQTAYKNLCDTCDQF
jgi:hypothetical protein